MSDRDRRCVQYSLGEGALPPFKGHGDSDAGWDLYVSRDCVIQPGETKDVHTDICIGMPYGIYARITGRSSTLRKHNLLVNEGIIDNGYTGELFICVRNMGDKPFEAKRGMRLAQVLFGEIIGIDWKQEPAINSKPGERGDKGFGSTGV